MRFTGSALTEGVERHRVETIDVPITNPARTIVDCFRYRAKVGLDVAWEAFEKASAAGGVRPMICGVTRKRRGSGQ